MSSQSLYELAMATYKQLHEAEAGRQTSTNGAAVSSASHPGVTNAPSYATIPATGTTHSPEDIPTEANVHAFEPELTDTAQSFLRDFHSGAFDMHRTSFANAPTAMASQDGVYPRPGPSATQRYIAGTALDEMARSPSGSPECNKRRLSNEEADASPNKKRRQNAPETAQGSSSAAAAETSPTETPLSPPNPKKRALEGDDGATRSGKRYRLIGGSATYSQPEHEVNSGSETDDNVSDDDNAGNDDNAEDYNGSGDDDNGANENDAGNDNDVSDDGTDNDDTGNDSNAGHGDNAGDDEDADNDNDSGDNGDTGEADDDSSTGPAGPPRTPEDSESDNGSDDNGNAEWEQGAADTASQPCRKRKAEDGNDNSRPSKKAQTTRTKSLLALPAELRVMILRELFGHEEDQKTVLTPGLVSRWPCKDREKCTRPQMLDTDLAILVASKQLNAEGLPEFLGQCNVAVVAGPRLCSCKARSFEKLGGPEIRAVRELQRLVGWLKRIGPRSRAKVRHMTLDVSFVADLADTLSKDDNFLDLLIEVGDLLKGPWGLVRLDLRLDLPSLGAPYSPATLALSALSNHLRNVKQVVINGHTVPEKGDRDRDSPLPQAALDAGRLMMREADYPALVANLGMKPWTEEAWDLQQELGRARYTAERIFPETLKEMDADAEDTIYSDVVKDLVVAVLDHGEDVAVAACEELWDHPDATNHRDMARYLSQVPGWDGRILRRERSQRKCWRWYKRLEKEAIAAARRMAV